MFPGNLFPLWFLSYVDAETLWSYLTLQWPILVHLNALIFGTIEFSSRSVFSTKYSLSSFLCLRDYVSSRICHLHKISNFHNKKPQEVFSTCISFRQMEFLFHNKKNICIFILNCRKINLFTWFLGFPSQRIVFGYPIFSLQYLSIYQRLLSLEL